jgi:membrane protein
VILLGLVTIIVVPLAFNLLPDMPLRNWLIGKLPWMAIFFIVLLVIGIIYRYGPNVKTPRTAIFTWGSLFAALAWAGASYGFSAYLSSFNSYNKIYGSIGAVVALLMWFFLGGFSVLLGALINLELARRRRFIAAKALRQAAQAGQGSDQAAGQ